MDPLYITSQNSSGNGTSSSLVNDTDVLSNQFVQPVWQIVLWAIAYCCIVLVSVVGNITVIWIILAHKLNLAFAEASMSAFNTVINFVYAVHNEWYFGLVYCRFHNFFPIAAVFASIYSMTAIALDRPKNVVRTLHFASWLREIAFEPLMCCPSAASHACVVYRGKQCTCIMALPIMAEYVIWRRKIVVKMMIVVECTFAICWLPYHVYFLLHQFLPHLFEEQYIQQVYLGIMWLAMSSTMYNPIIYCLLNDRFRAGFQQAFSWCPCVPQGSYEGLELKSTRYLQTQASIYRASRMETTVSTVMPVIEGDLRENTNQCSIDLASNGSSQSASKTVSESSSFYSSNNLA
uniref:Substance-P receptor n=1 Tax=Sinocyclocheilus grahami TaxID=75366 RepID=A0A672RB04_SINGR